MAIMRGVHGYIAIVIDKKFSGVEQHEKPVQKLSKGLRRHGSQDGAVAINVVDRTHIPDTAVSDCTHKLLLLRDQDYESRGTHVCVKHADLR